MADGDRPWDETDRDPEDGFVADAPDRTGVAVDAPREPHETGRANRLEPEDPEPENVIFVLVGMILALFVIARGIGLL